VFHSRAWLAVLNDTYGFEIDALASGTDGDLSQAVAFARLEGRLVAMPFSDYWALPLYDDVLGNALLTLTLRRFVAGGSFEARGEGGLDYLRHGFKLDAAFFRHRILLDAPFDELQARFQPAARRAIRKAQREGVTVRRSTDVADMGSFYELVVQTRRKQGLLPQPRRFFEAIQHHFLDAGDGFLLLAEHGGRVIAGDLLLSHRRTLTYKFNASDAAYLDLRPNNLLMAAAIEMALEDGYRELDLGRCDLDAEGLRRYKLLWGCVEEEYRYYRYDAGPPPKRHRDPVARALPLFVRVAPPWALKLAGDRLYRRFA
jgi:hypothetical protein